MTSHALPRVETLDACHLAPEDALQCALLLHAVWPADAAPGAAPAPLADLPAFGGLPSQHPERHIARTADGAIGAHALTFARNISVGGARETIMALAGVAVRSDLRGRGWGRLVAEAAFARVKSGAFAWSLFQTKKPGFYAKLGCREIGNLVVNSLAANPRDSAFWDDYAIVYPAAASPEGVIDLLGPGY